MRKLMAWSAAVALTIAACSSDAPPIGAPTPGSDVTTTARSDDAPADAASAPTTTAAPAGLSTTVPPFEPEPTTPTGAGEDLDDVLRAERATTTTMVIHSEAPPDLSLEAGPLGWVLRATPDPGASVIQLLADEQDCDGARPIDERLASAVAETETEVRIGVERIADVSGERAPCTTSPLTPLTVSLGTPLGDRTIIAADRLDPVVVDDVVQPIAVVTSPNRSPVTPATLTAVADPALRIALDCEEAGAGIGRAWSPSTEYLDPMSALADGANVLDLTSASWHEIVIPSDAVSLRQWIVAAVLDGGSAAAVAVVTARPGVAGWTADGSRCSGDLAARAIDDVADVLADEGSAAGSAARPALTLDLREIVSTDDVPGLSVRGDTLVFDDPSTRCSAWTALEDALLAAGATLGPVQTRVDPTSVPAAGDGTTPVAVRRQVQRRISTDDGRAALLTTTSDGAIAVTPALARASEPPSRLSPCRLDGDEGSILVISV